MARKKKIEVRVGITLPELHPEIRKLARQVAGAKAITTKESVRTAEGGGTDLTATLRAEAQRVAAIADLAERENEIFRTLESCTQIFADAQEVARGLLALDRAMNALHREAKSKQNPRQN